MFSLRRAAGCWPEIGLLGNRQRAELNAERASRLGSVPHQLPHQLLTVLLMTVILICQMKADQVLAAAGEMISELGIEQDPMARATSLPDIRTFRWYCSQKLIDRPKSMQGTGGVYGRRHVLQVVAIKSLQAQRLPLREIRMSLADASDRRLEELIRSPKDGVVRSPLATKRPDHGPQKDRQWLHFQPADGVLVMVAVDVVASARPSSLRALGEMVTTSLLSCRT